VYISGLSFRHHHYDHHNKIMPSGSSVPITTSLFYCGHHYDHLDQVRFVTLGYISVSTVSVMVGYSHAKELSVGLSSRGPLYRQLPLNSFVTSPIWIEQDVHPRVFDILSSTGSAPLLSL
jgi:hypothetical protein